MSRGHAATVALIVSAFVILAAVPLSSDSDGADPSVSSTMWCYGDGLWFTYGISGIGDEVEIEWELDDNINFTSIPLLGEGKGETFFSAELPFNASSHDELYVKQTVTRGDAVDVKIIKVILMHIGNGNTYSVSFHVDGVLHGDIQYICNTTTVVSPNAFVTMPDEPTKDGYTFKGWYWDSPSGAVRFDPFAPVESDMDLYAQWAVADDRNVDPDSGGGNNSDWLMYLLIAIIIILLVIVAVLWARRREKI